MVIPFALRQTTGRGARNIDWNVNSWSLNLTTTEDCGDLGPCRVEGVNTDDVQRTPQPTGYVR